MTTERADGILLRRHSFSETSLIAHWLTREQGRLATVVRGAQRPKSGFRGKLDVFFHAEFLFRRSRRSDLHTLTDLRLIEIHPNLRTDIVRLETAAYAVRLIEQNTESEYPVAGLHALFARLLLTLDRQGCSPLLVPGFELQALAELGLLPDPATVPLSSPARALMRELIHRAPDDFVELTAVDETVAELDALLPRLLTRHLGRVPRGRPGQGSKEKA